MPIAFGYHFFSVGSFTSGLLMPIFSLQCTLPVLLPVAVESPYGVVGKGAPGRMPGIIAPRPPQKASQRRRALGTLP
jgi:hypothetical protein